VNGYEIIKRLEAAGWRLRETSGSHHMMEKDGQKVPIPVHGSQDLTAGTLSAIRRQTGEKLR